MDHAEVLARLADAAATRRGIALLDEDRTAEGVALMRHLEQCPDCRSEVTAWERLSAVLVSAAPDSMRAPADARNRILAAVVRDGEPRGVPAAAQVPAVQPSPQPVAPSGTPTAAFPVPRRVDPVPRPPAPLRFRRLALMAAAVAAIFVAGGVLGPTLGLTPKDRAVAALVAALQASDRILQQAGHRQAVLTRRDGTPAGSVLVDPASGQIVVLSTERDISGGADYHCYLVRDGAAPLWIGPMRMQDGTSYWAGRVTSVADLGRPGDIVQVKDGGSAPELTATF